MTRQPAGPEGRWCDCGRDATNPFQCRAYPCHATTRAGERRKHRETRSWAMKLWKMGRFGDERTDRRADPGTPDRRQAEARAALARLEEIANG